MDNIIIKYLRVIVKRKAYVDVGEGSRGVSLASVQVFPMELELACKRINGFNLWWSTLRSTPM